MARVEAKLIALEVDGEDRSDEVTSAIITNAEAEKSVVTYADIRGEGGRDWALEMTILQDLASDTLWDLIWTGVGTEVDGVYAPLGNVTPSPTEPHYEFTAKVSYPDGAMLGIEATTDKDAYGTVEVSWALTGKPTKITA